MRVITCSAERVGVRMGVGVGWVSELTVRQAGNEVGRNVDSAARPHGYDVVA